MFWGFIDYLVLLAILAIVVDVAFQISKVKEEHESRDISITGAVVRFVAASVLMAKFVLVKDWALIVGQTVFLVVFIYYLGVLIHYSHKKRKNKKSGGDRNR